MGPAEVTTGPGRPDLRAGAVVTRRNDLLVVRGDGSAEPNRWSVPTSPVRRGELLVEAAIRAVGELTGLAGLSGPSIGWYESVDTDTARTDTARTDTARTDTARTDTAMTDTAVTEPADADGHQVVVCFDVVVLDAGEPTAGPDVVEARWMPVWEFSELPIADGLAELLAEHGVIDTLA